MSVINCLDTWISKFLCCHNLQGFINNRVTYGRLQGVSGRLRKVSGRLAVWLAGWLAGWLPAQYGPKDACMCPPDACVAHFEAYHFWRDLSYRFRHTLSLFLWDLWSQSWCMAAFVSRLALRAVRVHPASKRVLQSRSKSPSWDLLKFVLFIYSLLQWFPSNSCTEGDLNARDRGFCSHPHMFIYIFVSLLI